MPASALSVVPTMLIFSHAAAVVGLYTTPIPRTEPEGDGDTEADDVGDALGVAEPVAVGDDVALGLSDVDELGVGLSLGVSVGVSEGV